MERFVPRSIELRGGFTVSGEMSRVFELFSPLGETRWVPGWNPEILHPPDGSWERGMIFRTREESGAAVWVVSALDRAGHEVEYHRIEPELYVARISVRCTARAGGVIEVGTSYAYLGLTPAGNEAIGRMSDDDYHGKMQRWAAWIAGLLDG